MNETSLRREHFLKSEHMPWWQGDKIRVFIAQNVAHSIFCPNQYRWKKVAQKLRLLVFFFFKKLSKVNNYPIGKNHPIWSPCLMTGRSSIATAKRISSKIIVLQSHGTVPHSRFVVGPERACKVRTRVGLGLYTAGLGFCGPGLTWWADSGSGLRA
jgi:hypothetical protein